MDPGRSIYRRMERRMNCKGIERKVVRAPIHFDTPCGQSARPTA